MFGITVCPSIWWRFVISLGLCLSLVALFCFVISNHVLFPLLKVFFHLFLHRYRYSRESGVKPFQFGNKLFDHLSNSDFLSTTGFNVNYLDFGHEKTMNKLLKHRAYCSEQGELRVFLNASIEIRRGGSEKYSDIQNRRGGTCIWLTRSNVKTQRRFPSSFSSAWDEVRSEWAMPFYHLRAIINDYNLNSYQGP